MATKERFNISKTILMQGYGAKVPKESGSDIKDSFIVTGATSKLQPDENGHMKRIRVPGSVFDPSNKRETGKQYFEDLTPYQVHVLSHAHVIELTKDQAEAQKEAYK